MVPHRSTNLARQCLTSLSRREAVLSLGVVVPDEFDYLINYKAKIPAVLQERQKHEHPKTKSIEFYWTETFGIRFL